jgi:hypothetical protein
MFDCHGELVTRSCGLSSFYYDCLSAMAVHSLWLFIRHVFSSPCLFIAMSFH